MTPDELITVQRSWSRLLGDRPALLAALTERFAAASGTIEPADRARWLLAAADELVELLPAPSRLATQARAIGATWPDPLTAPSYATEGRAWLAAAADRDPRWSDEEALAWKGAWLLLSDVLAAEALSPFVDLSPGTPPMNPATGTRTATPTAEPHPEAGATGPDTEASTTPPT